MDRPVKIEDIREFELANGISREAIANSHELLKGIRQLDERLEVEPFLRQILADIDATPHTSTEIADILTTHATVSGSPCLSAFINKGKSYQSVKAKDVAHQFHNVKHLSGLGLIVLLAVGTIHDSAKDVLLLTATEKQCGFAMFDALDVARLFIAYKFVCPIDGNPYVQGRCRKCGATVEDGEEVRARLMATEALVVYKQKIARVFRNLNFRGIDGLSNEIGRIQIPIADIYVEPFVTPTQPSYPGLSQEPSVLHTEYPDVVSRQWLPMTLPPPGSEKVGLALQPCKHAAVLSSPGGGKTTLLQFLSWACASGQQSITAHLGWNEELTPFFISLACFSKAMHDRPGLTFQSYIDEFATEEGGPALRTAIRQELNMGRVLVLVDGEDEIHNSNVRSLTVQALDKFLQDSPENRFLITSRQSGYIPLAAEIARFTLCNFTTQNIEEFVTKWYRALSRLRQPDVSGTFEADTMANSLLNEIARSPQLVELASIPLLLVIIIMVYRKDAALPERRAELYETILNTLLNSWNDWRSNNVPQDKSVSLSLRDLKYVLGAVADWSLSQESYTALHVAEVERLMADRIRDLNVTSEAPNATARSYLDATSAQAGILERRTANYVSFWHHSFAEYLAAVYWASQSEDSLKGILPKSQSFVWHEVIRLTVAYLSVIQHDVHRASRLLQAIAKYNPYGLEAVLHTSLCLAATCITDEITLDDNVAGNIIKRLATLVQVHPYEPLIQAFVELVNALPLRYQDLSIIVTFIPLTDHFDPEVRLAATRIIANLASSSEEAREVCFKLLADNDMSVRVVAGLGIAHSGRCSLEDWTQLLLALPVAFPPSVEVQALMTLAPAEVLSYIRKWVDERMSGIQLKVS